MTRKERVQEVLKRLRQTYKRQPDTFVMWSSPLELLIATVLSAQCTDVRVNRVTRDLFKKYKTAKDYANASLYQLQEEIGSVTFYKSKAKYLKRIGEILVEKYHGTVPRTPDELMELPGVAKKTASLIMAKAFKQFTGVAVDTHVRRVAPRLGLTTHDKPDKISVDLEKILEPKDYLDINEYLIMHGRAICKPKKPLCAVCPLQDICPSAKKFLQE